MAIFPRSSGSSPAWPYPANASSPSTVRSGAPQSPATRTFFTSAPSTMSWPCARVSHSFTCCRYPASPAGRSPSACIRVATYFSAMACARVPVPRPSRRSSEWKIAPPFAVRCARRWSSGDRTRPSSTGCSSCISPAPRTWSKVCRTRSSMRSRARNWTSCSWRRSLGCWPGCRRSRRRSRRARDPEARGDKSLLHRSLASLTADEVQRMRTVVRRLAERLKTRLSRRRKVRRRGSLSVRRTLRKNLSTGGEPYKLVFRARRPERPEIVVLCDVSDSVRNVSRLMLQFVYTLQELYARVRSFVFVSDIGDVTHLFKKTDVSTAVDLATAGRVINLSANSNYGHALKLFHGTWLGSITRRTTVIVIGDGRTNYNPPNAWVLGDLRRKCRRLIWLCPEEQHSWGFGDSEMPLYARHCHRVESVRSVDDLGRVAAELMP